MQAAELISGLSRPEAYPFAVAEVELRQTHISLVFLTGPYAYKVKKPVALGFLDFSTLERRRHFCEEEVRLNRRLAPTVYRGVVPITRDGAGLHVEGSGAPIEWAVKMVRLPEDATLESRIDSGRTGAAELESLATIIARFHRTAATSSEIASYGRFELVARNVRENFTQSRPDIGTTVHPDVFERLHRLSEAQLAALEPLIDSRAARGVPRDSHGDLHLDHVYRFPDRTPPDDWAIVDCIEFNERFRYADPVADMAFLIMDLKFHGRADLARVFEEAYFRSCGDEEGNKLVRFYAAYRSIVRAKVGGIKLREPEVGKRERSMELQRAKAHWLLALGELEEPARRPCLLLIGGLPGTGKSTLARLLAERHGFEVIRSDVVRKRGEGAAGQDHLYSAEAIEQNYAECRKQAGALLFAGRRVIVDATFREERQREQFIESARRLCVSAHWFECQASSQVAHARIAARKNDASDATLDVYNLLTARWERATEKSEPFHDTVDTNSSPLDACRQAESVLRARELL